MSEKFVVVKRKFIKEPEAPVRTYIEEEKFRELVESIKAVGIIEPLVCLDCRDHLEIIAGHRRFMAAEMAGLEQIPCIIKKQETTDVDTLKIHENYGREEVNAVDEGFFFAEYIQKKGITINEFCKQISKTRAYVDRRLSVTLFPKPLLEAVKDNVLSFSCAMELMKIDNENEINRAIAYSRSNGCTQRQARAWVEMWERTKMQIDYQNIQPEPEDESAPVGQILWSCFICDSPENATATYNVPLCKQCHTEIQRQKAERTNSNTEQEG